MEWSDDFKGGKAVHLSGILDQLSYRVQKALFVGSMKCSFSTACCILKSNGAHVSSMYFLIQSIGRDVPVIQPDKSRVHLRNSDSPVALQEQKEIFLLPTIKVYNLLHSEIHVLLSERGKSRNFMGCQYFLVHKLLDSKLLFFFFVFVCNLVQMYVQLMAITLGAKQPYRIVQQLIFMLILPLYSLLLL